MAVCGFSRTEVPGRPILGHDDQLLQLLSPSLVPPDRALGVAVTAPGKPRSRQQAVKRSIRI
jgi:hypothetical protein